MSEYESQIVKRLISEMKSQMMPLLKVINYDTSEQIEKIEEEFWEFMSEVEIKSRDNDILNVKAIYEGLDVITAIFTYLTHEFSKEEIEKALQVHCLKILGRGWETKGTIKIEVEQ